MATCPRVIDATSDGKSLVTCGAQMPCSDHSTKAPLPGCPHGMPAPATCLECMEDGPVAPPARWKKVGGAFAASYPGACPAGDAIEIGDLVQRWDRDDTSKYAHSDCGAPT
jgi:hypothetical protein